MFYLARSSRVSSRNNAVTVDRVGALHAELELIEYQSPAIRLNLSLSSFRLGFSFSFRLSLSHFRPCSCFEGNPFCESPIQLTLANNSRILTRANAR